VEDMKNKILLNIIVLVLIANTGIYSKEQVKQIIPERIYDDNISYGINYGKAYFQLRKFFKVNLTNSGDDEYIAFYYECTKRCYEPNLYNLVRLYRLNKNKINKIYKIDHVCLLDYNESDIDMKLIKELEKYFGAWNGYFYVYDLNGNGVPELFLYDLGGIGGSFGIYEFNKEKDKFEILFDPSQLSNYAKMLIDKEKKAFIIYEPYEPKGNYPAHVLQYAEVEYKWDDKKKRYERKKLRDGLTYEDVEKINK